MLDLSELVFCKILKSDRENGAENTTHLKIAFSVFIVGTLLSAWRGGGGGGGVEPPTKFSKRGGLDKTSNFTGGLLRKRA